jgi:hypothetical protein
MSVPAHLSLIKDYEMHCRVDRISMTHGDGVIVEIFPRPNDYGNSPESDTYCGVLCTVTLKIEDNHIMFGEKIVGTIVRARTPQGPRWGIDWGAQDVCPCCNRPK